MQRRPFLSRLLAVPLLAAMSTTSNAAEQKPRLKIMMKSAWGSDDPTKAAFPFLHGHALAEAGHEAPWNAKFGNPTIFVSLVEWSDRIITE